MAAARTITPRRGGHAWREAARRVPAGGETGGADGDAGRVRTLAASHVVSVRLGSNGEWGGFGAVS